jgi:hypothetical protein
MIVILIFILNFTLALTQGVGGRDANRVHKRLYSVLPPLVQGTRAASMPESARIVDSKRPQMTFNFKCLSLCGDERLWSRVERVLPNAAGPALRGTKEMLPT